jgi:lipopolysaccharide biosynthesis protein
LFSSSTLIFAGSRAKADYNWNKMPKPYHPYQMKVREDRSYLPSIRRVRRIVIWGLSTVFFFRDQRFKLSHLKLENRPAVAVLAQNVTGKMSDAFQRLSVSIASYRPGDAANQKILNVISPPKTCGLSVALYLQVGYGELWSDMLSCAANVVYGSKVSGCKNVDVFVSLVDARVPFLSVQTVRNELLTLRDVGKVVVKKFDNLGADIGAFLQMLHQQREERSDEYDIILKMHSKGDSIWRERGRAALFPFILP